MSEIYLIVIGISFLISLAITPLVIRMVIRNRLLDHADDQRKVHLKRKPTMGGIAITISVGVVSLMAILVGGYPLSWVIFPALAVMFITGLRDDQVHLSATTKLVIQLVVAVLVILIGDMIIVDLGGLFGVYSVPMWIGFIITLGVFVGIINAYNLIDGIDGLAAGLGVIAALFFGIWNSFLGETSLAILSFALVGALGGFLIYNFSPAKIFMGDTGSLVVGFILATLAVAAISQTEPASGIFPIYFLDNRIQLTLAALLVPLYDTLRVFTLRLARGVSPFTAGKDHIHHVLLGLGLTHSGVSIILYLVTLISLVLTISLDYFLVDVTLIFIILIVLSVLMLPTIGIKRLFLRKLKINPIQFVTGSRPIKTITKVS